jgi:ABC-type transporter Mla subunit MlaD
MATVCRTLGVNAAFLQEIKEDSQQLRDLLAATRTLLQQQCHERSDIRQWWESLSELRDQLALHFALEDAYGYFEDAMMQAPRFSQRAEMLRGQHDGLFRDICSLADRADDLLHARPSNGQLRHLSELFLDFHSRFAAHERDENALIMAAFDDDIGVGD